MDKVDGQGYTHQILIAETGAHIVVWEQVIWSAGKLEEPVLNW